MGTFDPSFKPIKKVKEIKEPEVIEEEEVDLVEEKIGWGEREVDPYVTIPIVVFLGVVAYIGVTLWLNQGL